MENIENKRVLILRENRGSTRINYLKSFEDLPIEDNIKLIQLLKDKQEKILDAFKLENKILNVKRNISSRI